MNKDILTETAPEKIWLIVDTDRHEPAEAFPSNHEDISWCAENLGGDEVEYVRADKVRALLEREERGEVLLRRASCELGACVGRVEKGESLLCEQLEMDIDKFLAELSAEPPVQNQTGEPT